MQALAAAATPITAYSSEQLEAIDFCRICHVDPQAGTLVLESAASEQPPAGDTLLVAVRQDAKLQFSLVTQWQANDGTWQCCCPLPDNMVRLQRRAYQRLEAPVGRNYTAEFQLLGQWYQLPISDVSLGGVGLRASPHTAGSIRAGLRMRNVHIELDDGVAFLAHLEVRLCRPFRSPLLGEQFHIGCRFLNLPSQALVQLEQSVSRMQR